MFKRNQLSVILATSIIITNVVANPERPSFLNNESSFQPSNIHHEESPKEREARTNREFDQQTTPKHYWEKQITGFAVIGGAIYYLYKWLCGNKKEADSASGEQKNQSFSDTTASGDAQPHNESADNSTAE